MERFRLKSCFVLFGLVSLSFYSHADVEYGDNWVRYTFHANSSKDVDQEVGQATEKGWKYEMSDKINPVCLLKTKPLSIVSATHVQVKILFNAMQWILAPHPLKISNNGLFGVSNLWKELGEDHSDFRMIPSTALTKWAETGQTIQDDYIYFLMSDDKKVETNYEIGLSGSEIDDFSLSICFPFDRTEIEIYELSLTFMGGDSE